MRDLESSMEILRLLNPAWHMAEFLHDSLLSLTKGKLYLPWMSRIKISDNKCQVPNIVPGSFVLEIQNMITVVGRMMQLKGANESTQLQHSNFNHLWKFWGFIKQHHDSLLTSSHFWEVIYFLKFMLFKYMLCRLFLVMWKSFNPMLKVYVVIWKQALQGRKCMGIFPVRSVWKKCFFFFFPDKVKVNRKILEF